jgi:hypothetical protein
MKKLILGGLFVVLGFIPSARAETVRMGSYSGRPGYFVKIGTEFQLTLDVLVMNAETLKALQKLTFSGLGGMLTCEVEGTQQSLGTTVYTLFKLKSCK